MTQWEVQFTARKRDPATGERYRWRWGPYGSEARAKARAEEGRRRHARVTRVEVVRARGGR